MLPTDAKARKEVPIATGVVDYFPDALAAVAELSCIGNGQHNPGKPLHWDRSKSGDESDALMRHFVERGKRDTDGVRHSTKVAWRALALLQKEIEAEQRLREKQEEKATLLGDYDRMTFAKAGSDAMKKLADRVLEAAYADRRHAIHFRAQDAGGAYSVRRRAPD